MMINHRKICILGQCIISMIKKAISLELVCITNIILMRNIKRYKNNKII